MPPKAKGKAAEEKPPANDKPRSKAMEDLEAAQAEVALAEEKVQDLQRRFEELTGKVAQAKKLEEQLATQEEAKKKVYARFKRMLLGPERGERSESIAATQSICLPNAGGGLILDANTQKQLKDMVSESQEVLMRILSETFRPVEPPVPGEEPKPCPLGISQDVYNKVLDLRQQRVTIEEEMVGVKGQLDPLKEEISKEKSEGVGKPLIKRLEKVLHGRREEEKEARRRVEAEEDEMAKAKEEEEWQNQLMQKVGGRG